MGDLVSGALVDVDPDTVALVDVDTDEVLSGDLGPDQIASFDAIDVRVDDFEVTGRRWRVVADDDQPALSAVQPRVAWSEPDSILESVNRSSTSRGCEGEMS